jgi:hypothetical protein
MVLRLGSCWKVLVLVLAPLWGLQEQHRGQQSWMASQQLEELVVRLHLKLLERGPEGWTKAPLLQGEACTGRREEYIRWLASPPSRVWRTWVAHRRERVERWV